jgi:epoxide hydrolase-like predicted phosphatase
VQLEAVLFDFGGVFTISPFTTVQEGGAEHGIDIDVALELCFGPYHEDTDHPWHRLERGEMTLPDCRAALAELAAARGLDVDPLSFLIRQQGDDTQRAEVIERARAVRAAGIRTAVVTNNVAEYGDIWRQMVPVEELFEVVIDSCKAGVRKPDSRMFQLALDALDVTADRAVLLDDHPANIAAAEAMGIHGILVGTDRLAAFDRLDEMLGSPARSR